MIFLLIDLAVIIKLLPTAFVVALVVVIAVLLTKVIIKG